MCVCIQYILELGTPCHAHHLVVRARRLRRVYLFIYCWAMQHHDGTGSSVMRQVTKRRVDIG